MSNRISYRRISLQKGRGALSLFNEGDRRKMEVKLRKAPASYAGIACGSENRLSRLKGAMPQFKREDRRDAHNTRREFIKLYFILVFFYHY